MISINGRLLLTASLILVMFFGITGVILDRIYFNYLEQAQRNRLLGYVYDVLNATDFTQYGQIIPPKNLPEVRFSIPGSGLYAQIVQNHGEVIWKSESMSVSIPFQYKLRRGQQVFGSLDNDRGQKYYFYSFGISWDESTPFWQSYTFSIAESSDILNADFQRFRRSLWGSLAAVTILLLAVQAIILRWGLSPLRKVTEDLKTIEAGNKLSLDGTYPPEIRRLTDDLNALLHNHNENLKRYRQALGDLAHSLKTPLALLHNTVESNEPEPVLRKTLANQVQRMSQIIEYQLQRAATAGRSAFATPIEVKIVVDKILGGLGKVYKDKGMKVRTDIAPNTRFFGDEGDLMEILGNLLDNAYKYGRSQVEIHTSNPQYGTTRPGFTVVVGDDGPGIAEDQIEQALLRGIRMDENISGHGIGLAIVKDITNSYGGKLSIGRSHLGGAEIKIVFPGT